jgi:hypothetical protein
MNRLPKLLLIAGIVSLTISAVVIGKACFDEFQLRVGNPSGVDYGPIPIDLLRGRTHFEKRVDGGVVFSVDYGPFGESRATAMRMGLGVGILGVMLLIARPALRA